jgi:hypothetical protein
MVDEQHVRARCTQQSFERGRRYYERGMIFSTVQRGNTIEAQCQGSQFEPYHVKATIEGGTITGTYCSCPYDWGGDCKHIVALLLTWINKPEEFTERASIDEMLEGKSKEELITLIKLVLEHDPGLESLLDLALPVETPDGTRPTVDPENYRRRMQAILQQQDYDWDSLHQTAGEIGSLCSIGRRFLEVGDVTNATHVFQAIVEEGLFSYESIYDDDGIIDSVLAGAVEGLCDCLRETPVDAEERAPLFKAVYKMFAWDAEHGGYGMTDPVEETLADCATPDERRWMREQCEAALAAMGEDPDDTRRYGPGSWRRRSYGSFLLTLDEAEEDDDAFLEHARRYRLHEALFHKLLAMERIKQALDVAHAHFHPRDMASAADTLTQEGHPDEALKLIEDAYWVEENDWLAAWLVEAYKGQGQNDKALELQRKQFKKSRHLSIMQDILELVDEDSRQATRAELIAAVEKEQEWDTLTRFYMAEEAWSQAWDTVAKLESQPGRAARHYGYTWHGRQLELELADASAHAHPRQAAAAYVKRARELIAKRGRGNYQSAVGWLEKAREIHHRQNWMDEWEGLIKALKEGNKTLRALQDELQKAGL